MDPELRGLMIGLLTLFAWIVVLVIETAIQRRQGELERRVEELEQGLAARNADLDGG